MSYFPSTETGACFKPGHTFCVLFLLQSNLGYPNVDYPKLLGYSKTTDSRDFFSIIYCNKNYRLFEFRLSEKFVFRVCLSHCLVCSLQPCGHLLGRADLLVLLYMMFSCVFVIFPYGVLGQVWYLMVLIPDIFLVPHFETIIKIGQV